MKVERKAGGKVVEVPSSWKDGRLLEAAHNLLSTFNLQLSTQQPRLAAAVITYRVARIDVRCVDLGMFNFEKLHVWQKAIAFADKVYFVTRSFPPEERFGLTSQLRRASVSVSSNLAEGCSRRSKADYTRYIEIATGSNFEVVSQFFIARNQGLLTPDTFAELYNAALEITRMLGGLRDCLGD